MSLLRIENIETFYGKTQVLFGLSLHLEPGESLSLLGRNGAAKSTTLKSIIGLVPPRRGRILYRQEDITGQPPHRIARRGIGYAPQDALIFPDLTVRENLLLPRAARTSGPGTWNLPRIYEIFPQLEEMESKLGFALSGGQQKLLSIARALMTNPQLLLLDEPGEGLSPAAVSSLGGILKRIQATGVALVFAEHNLRFALELSDRMVIIERGAVRYQGASSEVRENRDILRKHLGVEPSGLSSTFSGSGAEARH